MLSKVVGAQQMALRCTQELAQLGGGAFILCDDYMQVAQISFYASGHTPAYYAGPYYVSNPKRLTQYDLWPDRSLLAVRKDGSANPLLGKNAIYTGKGIAAPKEITEAFERIELLPPEPVVVRDTVVKKLFLWRCYGFKGMQRPGTDQY